MISLDKQFRACAELDGWKIDEHSGGMIDPKEYLPSQHRIISIKHSEFPNYDSYDIIIPLIAKQEEKVLLAISDFLLDDLLDNSNLYAQTFFEFFIKKSPSQLREALLRATGKWQEE